MTKQEVLYKGEVRPIDDVLAIQNHAAAIWNRKLKAIAKLILDKKSIPAPILAKAFAEFVSSLQDWTEALDYTLKTGIELDKWWEKHRPRAVLLCRRTRKDKESACSLCGKSARYIHKLNSDRSITLFYTIHYCGRCHMTKEPREFHRLMDRGTLPVKAAKFRMEVS